MAPDGCARIGLRPISALVERDQLFTFDAKPPRCMSFDADKVADDLRVHRATDNKA